MKMIRTVDGDTVERTAVLAVELSSFADAGACDGEVRRVCGLDDSCCGHAIIYPLPLALAESARRSIRTRNVALGGAQF